MLLTIPDDVLGTLDMNEQELLLELAISLYSSEKISFGKARRLAGLDWYRFREILTERNIPVHYGIEQLEEDMINLDKLIQVK